MSETQLRHPVAEFAHFLTDLVHRLDPTAGWYGVFVHRDPEGLRACLEGRDVPPWDVVESMLHDLAGLLGDQPLHAVGPRARQLHARAVADHDAGPGGRHALCERLEVMRREHQQAALRARELQGAVWAATGAPEAERLAEELAWAEDDYTRAGVRVRELGARLEALGGAEAAAMAGAAVAAEPPAPPRTAGQVAAAEPVVEAVAGAVVEAVPQQAPERGARTKAKAKGKKPKSKGAGRPRGARFAGLEPAEEGVGAEDSAPLLPEIGPSATPATAPDGRPPTEDDRQGLPAAGLSPRGARFAGAYDEVPPAEDAAPIAVDAGAHRAAADAVARLAQLRAAGDGGLAHAELCAAANRPAPELPLLIGALDQAGLGSDVPTLLWEVACLPPDGLAAAADALAGAGRTQDSATLLRQGVARPVVEVGRVALELLERGRTAQARELLAALVRARTPEESAALAALAPDTLGPLLLDAATDVSPHRHSDIAHALRAAGHDATV
ncbi:hypothetical protein [Streptomyces sp. NPDC017993]|uniref:hypothetical protein n=1 Tax=Streptomyces sp. NPDC017993 TaxID=3365027 RepID=UPI0037888CCB